METKEVKEVKPVAEAVKAVVARNVVGQPQRMALAEHQRNEWVVNAEEGTTIEDIMSPGYWTHLASFFKPYDHVEVRVDTGEFLLELLVVNCDRNWAKVVCLHQHTLVKAVVDEEAPSLYEVKYKGPQLKHCVIRKSDGQVIKDSIPEKTEAFAWMRNYERTTS